MSLGEFRKLARQRMPLALERLDQILEDPDAGVTAVLTAIQLLTDRAYGKAVQPLEVAGPGVFEQMTDDELNEFVTTEAKALLGMAVDDAE
jgi:hypothetical protein